MNGSGQDQLARWPRDNDLEALACINFPFHLESDMSDITSSNPTGVTYFFESRISTLLQNPIAKSLCIRAGNISS